MIKREEEAKKKLPARTAIPFDAQGRRPVGSVLSPYEDNPAIAEADQRLAGMRRYRSSLGAEQERLTRGVTAAGETESLGQVLRALTTEIQHLRLGAAAEGAAEPRRQMAALESQRQQFGAAADAAEAAGDWQAFSRAAAAMDSLAANIKVFAEKAVKADAAVSQAMSIMGNMRRQ
jgi:hypothetical protein